MGGVGRAPSFACTGQGAPSQPDPGLFDLTQAAFPRPLPPAAQDFLLGAIPVRRFLCCARKKIWWMIPGWGKEAGELPPETQFLVAETEAATKAGRSVPLCGRCCHIDCRLGP